MVRHGGRAGLRLAAGRPALPRRGDRDRGPGCGLPGRRHVPARPSAGRVWGDVLSGELVGAGLGLVGCGLVGRRGRLALGVRGPGRRRPAARRRRPPAARAAAPPAGRCGVRTGDGTGATGRRRCRSGPTTWRSATSSPPGCSRSGQPVRCRRSPERYSLLTAVRVVLRVRTNVRLIIASSFGYFFFTGIQVFGLTFLRSRYGLDQVTASLLMLLVGGGAFAGVMLGGRAGDRLLRGGKLAGRILAAAGATLVAVVDAHPGGAHHGAWRSPRRSWSRRGGPRGGEPAAGRRPARHRPRPAVGPRRGGAHGAAQRRRRPPRRCCSAGCPSSWPVPRGAGLERTFLLMLVPLLRGRGRDAGRRPQLSGRRGRGGCRRAAPASADAVPRPERPLEPQPQDGAEQTGPLRPSSP